MSVELSLFRCLCDKKELFNKYYPYISDVKNMDRDMLLLFKLVESYYEQYHSESISKDDLLSFYDYIHPVARNSALHREMIHTAFEMNVNTEIAEDHLQKFMERHYSARVMTMLQPVIEGRQFNKLVDAKLLTEEYITKMKYPPAESRVLVPQRLTIEELVHKEISPEGLTWSLPKLNEAIGVVRQGKFGLAYAYVDTGKSSFGARQVAHWAPQLKDDERIIWAGNEEGHAATELRITQSLLNWDKNQIANNMEEAHRLRELKGFKRILIFDSIYHCDNIQKLLEQYGPIIIVIDQVTKLRSKGRVTKDIEALTYVANFCREKAKEFNCGIFGLTQAIGEAHDKLWLEAVDIYNSRVGIQGELDYAIGIGRNFKDPSKQNLRYFNISKNKFGEHARFAVMFESGANVWTEI